MGQILEACSGCDNPRGCDICVILRKWIADHVDAVTVVRCKECANRGDFSECPMCDARLEVRPEAGIEIRVVNHTEDDGFCHRGVKKDAVD